MEDWLVEYVNLPLYGLLYIVPSPNGKAKKRGTPFPCKRSTNTDNNQPTSASTLSMANRA